ncbi:MAG: apolipoprotein N-acyltransferase [Gemmatimonadota bacterium]
MLPAAALLGAAHAASFAPWNLPWLQLAALATLFALAELTRGARHAAWLGWCFGLGWFGVGVSWVYISMHEYGQMPAWLAAIATAVFAAYLALYPALALGAAHRLVDQRGPRLLLGLPAAWALSEWLRGVLLTGFPWLASGYAHADGPLAGYAPLVGVYGVTLIAASVAGLAAYAYGARAQRHLAALAVAVLVALVLVGHGLRSVEWTQPTGKAISVRLVQGNVPQDEKFADGGLQRALDTFFPLMQRAGNPDLVVLPESVFPIPLNYLPDEVLQSLHAFSRTTGAALVFGVFIEQPRGQYFNSAVGIRRDDEPPLQRYSKRHLVPFGEFIPWGFHWFVDLMQIPIGDQQRGTPYQGPMDLAGQRIAVNICYEDLFGAEIISAWRVPERAPTLLLNLSNLAWFDDSLALPQHLQISRMRAIETGRPMLRATNTGATAIIDARGNVVAQLPFRTKAVLDGRVQGYAGTTPYVTLGNLPALGLAGALLLAAALLARRSARQP